jgi:hypothetical protein
MTSHIFPLQILDGEESRVDEDVLIYIGETMRALRDESHGWLTARGGIPYTNKTGSTVRNQTWNSFTKIMSYKSHVWRLKRLLGILLWFFQILPQRSWVSVSHATPQAAFSNLVVCYHNGNRLIPDRSLDTNFPAKLEISDLCPTG